jgi:rsbT co-antagonist protein RsbR
MKDVKDASRFADIIRSHEREILADWIKQQLAAITLRADLLNESDLREQSRAFLSGVQGASQKGGVEDIEIPAWNDVKQLLREMSRQRALAGFSPRETATFVFSLKQPLFARMRQELKGNAEAIAEETWRATVLLDQLGLYTTEVYQKSREEVIERQQRELLELSTPVVELWEDVLALPLVGTLDSGRTQIVMESLLQKIVQTGASIAIIDITGVPTVDTLVAQHLLKTVAATRLMGADCIISGIRPQIAQTIVHLGVNLGEVTTKATLADAFQIALRRTGATIQKGGPNGQRPAEQHRGANGGAAEQA